MVEKSDTAVFNVYSDIICAVVYSPGVIPIYSLFAPIKDFVDFWW